MKVAVPSYQVRPWLCICACVGVEPPFLKCWIRHCGGMPPCPPRLSYYAAEFALATNLFSIYLSMWQSTLITKLSCSYTH